MSAIAPVSLHVAKSKVYVGIDPGKLGGIAVVYDDEVYGKTWAVRVPDTMRGILGVFDQIKHLKTSSDSGKKKYIIGIEKVTGYVAPGKRGSSRDDTGGDEPGSRMFQFGRNYGALVMASVAILDIYPQEIHPRTWQKGLEIARRREGETKPMFKKRLKILAQRTFPMLKVTSSNADALLIVTYLTSIDET